MNRINDKIQQIYAQAKGEPLTPAQKDDIAELRSLYRAINLRRRLPAVRSKATLDELGLMDLPAVPAPRKKVPKVKREPANVTHLRSVVSGGLPGLGKRR